MKKVSIIVLGLIMYLNINCEKDTADVEETGTIYGNVVLNTVNYHMEIGNIDSLCMVLIKNSVISNRTYTDNGFFEFSGVNQGEYVVAADIGGNFKIPGNIVNLGSDLNVNYGIFNIESFGDTDKGGKYVNFIIRDILTQRGITIFFDKTSETYTDWDIFDLKMNLVRSITGFYNPYDDTRTHNMTWNLRNQYNFYCSSGVYFIVTDDETIGNLLPM